MRNFNIFKNDNSFNLKENNKTFITGYEIDNNMLVVTFADKHKHSYPYSKETEEKIISLMEKQITNVIDDNDIQNGNDTSDMVFLMCGPWLFVPTLVLTVVSLIFVLSGSAAFPAILLCIGSLITGLISAKQIKKYIHEKKAYKDYQKAKLFIENKKLMSNVNLTINNISGLSLRKLRAIKEVIETYQNEQAFYNSLINESQVNCNGELPKQMVK